MQVTLFLEVVMSVASIILEQLGGNRFVAMTGASRFGSQSDSLQFRLPARFARDGINFVSITLLPSDTYRMSFCSLRGTKLRTVSECSDVYCDQLQSLFTKVTGLDTHL